MNHSLSNSGTVLVGIMSKAHDACDEPTVTDVLLFDTATVDTTTATAGWKPVMATQDM